MERPRYSVLLVDDEPLARQRLRQLLSTAPDFSVVGECGEGAAVPGAVRELAPDVVFLDVQMIDCGGFDVHDAIRKHVRHVLFVTAHPEYASKAFDVAALDYLVKPLTPARFNAALDRIRRAGDGDAVPRIFIGSQLGGALVPIRDILRIEADGAYVTVHTRDKRHVVRESVDGLLARVGSRFVRIHRSSAVNLDGVRAIKRSRLRQLEVELEDGTRVPVSRRRARELMDHMRPGAALRSATAPLATPIDH